MVRAHGHWSWLMLLAGAMIGLVVSGGLITLGQERSRPQVQVQPQPQPRPRLEAPSIAIERGPSSTPAPGAAPGAEASARLEAPERAGPPLVARAAVSNIDDALSRPYRFPFARPTTLVQVRDHLQQTLGVRVVLDRAALDRQDVRPDDTVQLELDDVRLKTGLKLLLDQLDLTYRALAEDNLLIISDDQGAEDPMQRVWAELKALHRDLHDIQDAIDDLTDAAFDRREAGPRLRQPTIIEEAPAAGGPPAPAIPVPEGPASPRKPVPEARVPAPNVPRLVPPGVPRGQRGSGRSL